MAFHHNSHVVMIICPMVMFGFILMVCFSQVGSAEQNLKPENQMISKKSLILLCIAFSTIALILWIITLRLFLLIVRLKKKLSWQLDPMFKIFLSYLDEQYGVMLVFSVLFTISYHIFFGVMTYKLT